MSLGYIVRCTQLVPTQKLDADDRVDLPAGLDGKLSYRDYEVPAGRDETEDDALDWFHETVPIRNLEDFDVSAHENETP
jgi:hypothetical protein